MLGASGALVALLAVVQIAAAPPSRATARHPLGAGSVWDSVYSMAQAGRGESTYRAICANCHGDSLGGIDDAPPLTGTAFDSTWNGNALSSLFKRISNDMPSDNPGTLTPPQVAEAVAFLLKYRGFPAGAHDLPAAAESLTTIKFLPKP